MLGDAQIFDTVSYTHLDVYKRQEQALLTHEQFERELNYDAALSIARRMLAAGLISRAEFVRIDAILREKFSPVWGGLYHSVA